MAKMTLKDIETGFEVVSITTNHRMTVDEALALSEYTVNYTEENPEGQLQDEDGEYVDAYYDNLDFAD